MFRPNKTLPNPVPRRVPCRTPSRGGGTETRRDPLAKCLDRGRAPYVAAAQLSQARANEILNLDQTFREMNSSIVANISVLCLQKAVGSIR